MRIVFLDRATLAPHVKLRRPDFDHEWVDHAGGDAAEALERARGADILVTNKVPVTAELLAAAPGLKCVAVAATGTDVVDKAACAARGIVVTNIRDYARAAVPEHTFALILALARALPAFRAAVQDGKWQREGRFCFFEAPISDLAGKRLGVVGAGSLGARVGELGRAFGMDVVFSRATPDARPDVVSLEALIETSDVISLHCPLTATTRHMLGAPQFARMKRRPLLINTARAGLVDEAALEQALEQGLVRGAGIDVASPEPPPADGPLMRMARRANVIVTPHVAWASDEAQQALADQLVDNIEAFAAGAPRNVV